MKKLAIFLVSLFLTLFALTQFASAAAYAPAVGGTGTTQKPNYGQILVGTAAKVYTPTATSSLGLPTFADIAGYDKGFFFSTTSANAWKATNNFYSTTSANFWSSAGLGFSTTSADYWYTTKSVSAFSTTSADYWLTQRNFFSTTSVDYWGSTKGYLTGNQTITLTGDVTGSGATSIATALAHTVSHWWSALQNFGNASTSQLTATSTVWLTALGTPAGQILAVDPNGRIIGTTTSAGGVTSVGATYPIQSTGGATPVLSIAFGTTTANTWVDNQAFGKLSLTTGSSTAFGVSGTAYIGTASTSNLTVSNIQSAILSTGVSGIVAGATITSPLQFAAGALSILQSTATQNGYLSSSDWGSFNGRLSTTTLGLFDKGYFFSTTSTDYWKTQNNFFSTTSVSHFSSLGLAFSTTSANAWSAVGLGFSTTSASYFLSQNSGNAFSTTSANVWAAAGLGFSTTSANAWRAVGLSFSTTSSDYWETQQTARTADDLTNNSIEDLNDVAAMTENSGDVFYWNGSTWTDIASSTLYNTAASSVTGLLSGTDWATFNNKAPTASPTFTGTLTFANATGTHATTTSLAVGNLSAVDCDVKSNGGVLYCGTDATGGGGGGAWPFTPGTYAGQNTSGTTTLLHLTGSPLSLAASSSDITNSTTTQLAITTLVTGRIPFTTTGGRLIDSSIIQHSGTTLTVQNDITSGLTAGYYLERTAFSVTAPAFTFVGDTNTGMYSPMSDSVGFSTNGVSRLSIGTSSVAIGTSTIGAYASTTLWGGLTGNVLEVVTGASTSALRVSSTGAGTTTLSGLTVSGLFYGAGLTDCSGGNVLTWTGGQFGCAADATGGGGGGAWPWTLGTNFGVAVNSTSTPTHFTAGVHASSTSHLLDANFYGNVGIGTTTPWGKLSVVKTISTATDYDAPAFIVATSSDQNGNGTLLSVFSTSTGPVMSDSDLATTTPGVRVGIGTTHFFGYKWMMEQLTIDGWWNQTESQVFSDMFVGASAAAATADATSVGGGWAFYEDGTGTMTAPGGTFGALYNSLQATAANDGAGLFFGDTWARAESNAGKLEIAARIGTVQSATSSIFYFGWTDKVNTATTFESEPGTGCYFIASSSKQYWIAVSRQNSAVSQQQSTGVASSTVLSGTGTFRHFKVEMDSTGCKFYIRATQNSPMVMTNYLTSVLPQGSDMQPTIMYGDVAGGAGSQLDFYRTRIFWRSSLGF